MKAFAVVLCSFALVAVARRPPRPKPTTAASIDVDTTAASSSSTDDDDYISKVKDLIDAGTCDSVSTSNVCELDHSGNNLRTTSYYATFEYSGYQVVVSSGVPDHVAETDAEDPNPNIRCERWQFVTLPIRNTGETVNTNLPQSHNMGTTGWATSGAVFFDHRSAPDGSTAWYNEGVTLDSCKGHSTADKEYHYHLNPVCIDKATDATACEHLGYMSDGYPVVGYCAVDGATLKSCYTLDSGENGSNHNQYTYAKTDSCHLDECNGYQFDWGYAYVMSEDYPYVPICFNGDSKASPCGFN